MASQNLKINPFIQTLFDLKLTSESDLLPFHNKVRDMKGIKVLRSKKSGLVVLDKINHIDFNYYENNEHYVNGKHQIETFKGIVKTTFLDDAKRRVDQYRKYIKGKSVLDFGCGRGEFVFEVKKISPKVFGLEPNRWNREDIEKQGIKCYRELTDIPEEIKFDYIFLNHVFHHLTQPIETLKKIKKYLNKDGAIVMEVRHGNDFLIEKFDAKEYRDFSFCSEHLILHTFESLKKFSQKAGFKKVDVFFYQRYPISNHMHWFMNRKPGGHNVLEFLNEPKLNEAYRSFLVNRKETDTLIAVLSSGVQSPISKSFD